VADYSGTLRIGINALYLIPGGVGGTEIYLRHLLRGFSELQRGHEYFVYINRETEGDLIPPGSGFRCIPVPVSARVRPARILYEQALLPRLLRRDRIDVLLNPGYTGPISFAKRSVTVFHDTQHKRHPEFFRWFDLPFWNLLLKAATRSRALIAVSAATAADLERFYPGSGRKTVVIQHGVDPEFFRIGEQRQSLIPEPFVLTVSTLHPHKNIARLLEAFREFRKESPGFRLVVAGMEGFAAQALKDRRRDLGLEDSVTFTGWIERDALYGLFRHASAYIAPSEFEGFGMPVSEALAAGLPTACSSIPPFLEIAGGAAILFSPDSTAQMVGAMKTITSDEAFVSKSKIEGPARARLFDWLSTARLTLEAIEAVAHHTRTPSSHSPALHDSVR
jgi:glycosyltransferase involved in cell wall biosynthesis